MSKDSLKKRFAYKLSSNIISFAVSFILAGLVPRTLGVDNYGSYNFLISIITQILLFVELRTSYCFFTKLSQRPEERNLQVFYSYCIFTFLFVFIVVISTVSFTSFRKIVFLDQTRRYIFLASGVVFISWISGLLGQMMDAYGKTIWLEKVQILFKVLSCVVLLLLAYTNYLNLDNYFAYQYATQGTLVFIFILYLRRKHEFSLFVRIPGELFYQYVKEFYQYCAPLFFYILIGIVYQLFDRWLLQYYGGAYQQGLYSFSFALSNICIMITSAILPLLQREMSIHAATNDIEGMAVLFRKLIPLIYGITACLSAFVFVEADLIVSLFGGVKYVEATSIFRISSLYPLIYAYGNLHSTIFYATSRTKTYLILAIIITPISIFSSFVFMSNGNYIGLDLGGKGLALKEFIIGFFTCVVVLFVNARYLRINQWKYFVHLIFVPVIFILFGYLARGFVNEIMMKETIFLFILASGIVYMSLSMMSVWMLPQLLGIDRKDLSNHWHNTTKYLKDKLN
ncbi:MAG: lipopolysaccharide biosynthesis protein [Methanosarcinaceae archaeon]|nr:lipopolysaccharide biosynthesis protein [Methanosarcinaceae archaeon]